jgi:hypothetical protein
MLLIEFPLEKTVLKLLARLMAPNVNLSVRGSQPARYCASVLRR